MFTREEIFYIWLDSFENLDYKTKRYIEQLAIENSFTEMGKVIKSNENNLLQIMSEDDFSLVNNSGTKEYTASILDKLNQDEITAITIVSDLYPQILKEYDSPPLVLYAKGNTELLSESEIFGIVGSRKSIALSVEIAKNYATELVKAGFTLVTGIAEGIDATVLNSALENNGKVISVIAGGFDNVYPQTNLSLMQRVVENGLVISEQPPSVKPAPYMFPIRNRIIAGLSNGALIVSGRKKSGTRHTAEYAVEYGKDLFTVPYSVGIESGSGCNELIKQGAILTDTPADILEYYGKSFNEEKIELSDSERAICELLKDGEKHVESVSSSLGVKVFELLPIFSTLEIKGIIVKCGANKYGLARSLEE